MLLDLQAPKLTEIESDIPSDRTSPLTMGPRLEVVHSDGMLTFEEGKEYYDELPGALGEGLSDMPNDFLAIKGVLGKYTNSKVFNLADQSPFADDTSPLRVRQFALLPSAG
jgi:hypothetical protein